MYIIIVNNVYKWYASNNDEKNIAAKKFSDFSSLKTFPVFPSLPLVLLNLEHKLLTKLLFLPLFIQFVLYLISEKGTRVKIGKTISTRKRVYKKINHQIKTGFAQKLK